MNNFVSYGRQNIDASDKEAVMEVLESNYLTQGPKIAEFEEALSDYTESRYCVVVNSGTAALQLAVKALQIPKGKIGITSPNTFAASANAILNNELKINFADIELRNYNIDPIEIKKNISDNSKLIIPVHFAGVPCDMESIYDIAKEKGINIIEDAAHAIGGKYSNGKKIGSCCYSNMTIFSFHPLKTMTTGEGGAITTNSKEDYERLLNLRTHGITKEETKMTQCHGPWYYEMQELSYNYRLTDIQAALGLSQLKRLDSFVQRRREIVKNYNDKFSRFPWIQISNEPVNSYSAYHLYVVRIKYKDLGLTRSQVMTHLKEKGIGSQVHYIPVHTHPYYQEKFGFKWGDYPRAEQYYEEALSLPLYPSMTDEDIKKVINGIIELEA